MQEIWNPEERGFWLKAGLSSTSTTPPLNSDPKGAPAGDVKSCTAVVKKYILPAAELKQNCGYSPLVGVDAGGVIASPNYPAPYPNNSFCIWYIMVRPFNRNKQP